jgi:hypothetical protein
MNLAEQADCKDELLQWRRRLAAKLAPRDAGLTDGEDLVCQAGKPYLVSPKYKERVQ